MGIIMIVTAKYDVDQARRHVLCQLIVVGLTLMSKSDDNICSLSTQFRDEFFGCLSGGLVYNIGGKGVYRVQPVG